MRLSVVLVHYHTPLLLADAVEALRADLREFCRAGGEAEIVVVDNGSTELERSQMEGLPVRRLATDRNLGYAGAINVGVEHTTGDLVVAMNPDVLVLPGCLSTLVEALEGGAAAAGPRLYWDRERRYLLPPTERRNRRCEIYAVLAGRGDRIAAWCRGRWRRHARRFWVAQKPFATICLSGAMLAFRRDALQRVGAFDEGFHLYFEEDDWLRRLRRHGLSARYVPAAEAVHLYNQSAAFEPRAETWFQQSATRFQTRYYGRWFVRLLGRVAPPAPRLSVPELLPSGRPALRLDPLRGDGKHPLWLEVSPLSKGFPAGATEVGDADSGPWRLPTDVWRRLAPGRYYLTACGGDGRELARFSFDRPAAEAGR